MKHEHRESAETNHVVLRDVERRPMLCSIQALKAVSAYQKMSLIRNQVADHATSFEARTFSLKFTKIEPLC